MWHFFFFSAWGLSNCHLAANVNIAPCAKLSDWEIDLLSLFFSSFFSSFYLMLISRVFCRACSWKKACKRLSETSLSTRSSGALSSCPPYQLTHPHPPHTNHTPTHPQLLWWQSDGMKEGTSEPLVGFRLLHFAYIYSFHLWSWWQTRWQLYLLKDVSLIRMLAFLAASCAGSRGSEPSSVHHLLHIKLQAQEALLKRRGAQAMCLMCHTSSQNSCLCCTLLWIQASAKWNYTIVVSARINTIP